MNDHSNSNSRYTNRLHEDGHTHDRFAKLFEYRDVARKRLVITLTITLVVMVVEIVGGLLTGSIALLSNAGHMFTHCFAIAISLIAVIIAKRPACHHRTFGLYRVEILAAFINGIVLLIVVGVVVYEAIKRIINPEDINTIQMLGIALVGLFVNIASILILKKGYKSSLNIRSVFYHMLGDAASSIGIIIAAAVIFYTDWNILDPIISIGISIFILVWAINILRDSSRILLEIAPQGLDADVIEEDLRLRFTHITKMEKVHLWSITTDMLIFSAHMAIKEVGDHDCSKTQFLEISRYLEEKYNIIETTLQKIDN